MTISGIPPVDDTAADAGGDSVGVTIIVSVAIYTVVTAFPDDPDASEILDEELEPPEAEDVGFDDALDTGPKGNGNGSARGSLFVVAGCVVTDGVWSDGGGNVSVLVIVALWN
jgi:hypothetical protein